MALAGQDSTQAGYGWAYEYVLSPVPSGNASIAIEMLPDAFRDLDGNSNFGQVFQYIQEYTGFISPGVLAIFVRSLRRDGPGAAIRAGGVGGDQ